MDVQVLLSTMNATNYHSLIKSAKIKKFVIINQITRKIKTPNEIRDGINVCLSVRERGLSRSRNKAILESQGDICMLADDDMFYVEKYETIVSKSYLKYKNADLIAFYVDNEDKKLKKPNLKEGPIGFLKSMKLSSVQITFKKKSIIDRNIMFDTRFGAGTDNLMGEENIFLYECLKKGLKIYYVPIKIATLKKDTQSSWFNGYDRNYFYAKGRVFDCMTTIFAPILIIQFAIRKYKLFKEKMNLFAAIKYMYIGSRLKVNNED